MNNHKTDILENQSNYFDIFQPKLLKIKNVNKLCNETELERDYYQQKINLNNKFKKLNEAKNQCKSDSNYTSELQQKVTSFYKNPFQFMDYLIEKYFKSQFDQFKKEDLYQKILNDFTLQCLDMKEKNEYLIKNEIENLKDLRNRILSNRELETIDFISQPVNHNEIIQVMSNEKFERFKSIVNSKVDVKNALFNNKFSNLGKNNVVRKTLECLKGDNIVPPKNFFIEVRDIDIKNANLEEYDYAKNVYDINKAFDLYKQETDKRIINQVHKTMNQEEMIFNDLLHKNNNSINKMENDVKVYEDILMYIKNKLNEEFSKDVIRLGIDKINFISSISKDIDHKIEEEIELKRDRLNILQENNLKAIQLADKLLENYKENNLDDENKEISDSKIEGMYEKYAKMNNKKCNNKDLRFSGPPESMKFKQKKLIKTTNIINKKIKKI